MTPKNKKVILKDNEEYNETPNKIISSNKNGKSVDWQTIIQILVFIFSFIGVCVYYTNRLTGLEKGIEKIEEQVKEYKQETKELRDKIYHNEKEICILQTILQEKVNTIQQSK